MPKKYFHVKYKLKSSFINLSFTILSISILQTYCNQYYGNVRFNFYITFIKRTALYSNRNILQFVVIIIFEITKSPVTQYSNLSLLTEIRKIPHHLVFAPSKVTSSIEKYHLLKSGHLIIRPDRWNLQVLQFLANCAWNSGRIKKIIF